jgi:hypothetical protein
MGVVYLCKVEFKCLYIVHSWILTKILNAQDIDDRDHFLVGMFNKTVFRFLIQLGLLSGLEPWIPT